MFGFINLNKPSGPTSHDMVVSIRRLLPKGVKVGHAGTLDPFASGVLVICIGPATRLADNVQSTSKRYRAVIELGANSDTDDVEGTITPIANTCPPTIDKVKETLAGFVGTIMQTPPAHSAIMVNGHRAYKMARQGTPLKLAPRAVEIFEIDLVAMEGMRLTVDVHCGSGTYIRSLARDIGEKLRIGGYCRQLTRTAVGEFTIDNAVTPADFNIQCDLLSPLLAMPNIPKIHFDDSVADDIATGKTIHTKIDTADGEVAVICNGKLMCLANADSHRQIIRPTKVFFGR